MVQMYLSFMEDVFQKDVVTNLKDTVCQAKSVVITSHRSPDGDALGSSLALQHLLASMGVTSHVILPDACPKFLHWMPGHDDVLFYDEHSAEAQERLSAADVVFCLDYNAPSRTGEMSSWIEASSSDPHVHVVMIDHHRDPVPFADVMLCDDSTGSTCELVFRLMEAWNAESSLSQDMAACLYCGLITDTGSFRFSSVQPSSHRMAAALLETGMDHSRIHALVYDTCRLDQIRLTSYALSQKLVVFPEHRSAIVSLSLEELQRFSAEKGDTEGLVNRALSIDGVNFAAFVKEDVDRVKLSLRSRGSFNVQEVAAEHFNGGGHHNAAGGACEGESLVSVVSRLTDLIPTWSEALQYED